MEKYYIQIWQEHEWSIAHATGKEDKKPDKVLDYFAGVRIVDEKIDFMMDISISDEEIEELKDNKYFEQKAIFIPRFYNGKTYKWTQKKSFQDSFTDALMYVKENYTDV